MPARDGHSHCLTLGPATSVNDDPGIPGKPLPQDQASPRVIHKPTRCPQVRRMPLQQRSVSDTVDVSARTLPRRAGHGYEQVGQGEQQGHRHGGHAVTAAWPPSPGEDEAPRACVNLAKCPARACVISGSTTPRPPSSDRGQRPSSASRPGDWFAQGERTLHSRPSANARAH